MTTLPTGDLSATQAGLTDGERAVAIAALAEYERQAQIQAQYAEGLLRLFRKIATIANTELNTQRRRPQYTNALYEIIAIARRAQEATQ